MWAKGLTDNDKILQNKPFNAEIQQKSEYIMRFIFVSGKSLLRAMALTLLAVTVISVLAGTGAYSVFFGYAMKKLPIYYVKTDEKKIAISFDCAWGVDYTQTLLSVMKDENVKSTFFCVQFWTEKYPEILKKVYDDGHEIGTHSASHPHMSKLGKSAITTELKTSCDAIEKVTGKRPELFRPPFGEYSDNVIDVAKEQGLYVIQWDVDSLDWKNLSAKEIENRVISRVKNGSIVLFHNQGLHTAEALPGIIKGLKAQGYKFVPIGELIYKNGYKIAPDGAQIKTNGNSLEEV
ncbi:MAG: polysaccharide deacetylase family protein [Clostridia bacterium]|nr:polysaccharide deacetylase family protein [Clostridia bacterium]